MELKSFVKVGNISNLSDARYCAGFGVNMLGFNIDNQQDNSISIGLAKELAGWVAVDEIVLECGNMSKEDIIDISTSNEIQCFQVDNLQVAYELYDEGLKVIYRVNIKSTDSILSFINNMENQNDELSFILIQCEDENLFEDLNQNLTRANISTPILKGYNIKSSTMNEILNSNSAFYGIAMNGSEEEKPGFKDYDELAEILELLEIDE